MHLQQLWHFFCISLEQQARLASPGEGTLLGGGIATGGCSISLGIVCGIALGVGPGWQCPGSAEGKGGGEGSGGPGGGGKGGRLEGLSCNSISTKQMLTMKLLLVLG